jgi:hypothetical protein
MLGWYVKSQIEYSLNLRPFWSSLGSNIRLHVRLICQVTNWIFTQPSAIPIIPGFQYLIACWADLSSHTLNIHSTFGYSDHSLILIFDCMLGWSVKSHIEYSLNLRLLWLFLDSNIRLHVRLICQFTHWIFTQPSAIPIIPGFQYLIACPANLATHTLNIHSAFGSSDYSCIPIIECMSGEPMYIFTVYSSTGSGQLSAELDRSCILVFSTLTVCKSG